MLFDVIYAQHFYSVALLGMGRMSPPPPSPTAVGSGVLLDLFPHSREFGNGFEAVRIRVKILK
jgi:hypothetical protein